MDDVIQLHDNVAPKRALRGHRLFGSQKHRGVVMRRAECDTLFIDLGERQERDHLETAGIGQKIVGPGFILVKALMMLKKRDSGANSKMIRITKD